MAVKKFSNKWKASKSPSKQRKYRKNAPLHKKQKMMRATLSKDLRKKYKTRSFGLRKGDIVTVMKGEFRKKEGQIIKVDMKKLKVRIEGLQIDKKDGTKMDAWFDPSNLKIKDFDLDDKKRKTKLEAMKKNVKAS